MKKIMRKLKRSNWLARYSYYFLLLVYLGCYIYFVKSLIPLKGVENGLRIIFIIIFLFWYVFYAFYNLLNLLVRKYKGLFITSIVTILFEVLFIFSSYFINVIYNGLNKMTDISSDSYTSYLIKKKDQDFNDSSVIGRISSEVDVLGYELTEEIINEHNLKNDIKEFDDYFDLVYTLYEDKVNAIFVPSNYVSLFSGNEGLENIANDVEIVYQYTKANESASLEGSNKDFSEPLTFLLMGVDSTIDGLNPKAGFNGDTLMLISFNPKTLDTLMVSVPRDTYVPIVCNNNRYAKINSSAAYGSDCVIDTVGNLLDVNIDYYVKINFKGVVKLVEALGGVEVDVEAPTYNGSAYGGKMCEQNSDRQFGDHLICLSPGFQTLNGEQALAYSRNRHLYINGDLDRIRHQQQVVEAIAKKLLNFSTFADFKKVFDAISSNIATNMSTDKVLSGYNVVKDMALNALNGEEFVNVHKATLETYSLPVYLPNSGNYTSAQGYYVDSLNDVKKAINVVLGKEKEEDIKTFNFSVNTPYEVTPAGKNLRKEKSLELMPNLIGSSITKAQEFCDSHNITLNIEHVDAGKTHYNDDVAPGLIGDQDVVIGTLLNNVSSLTIYVPNAPSSSSNIKDSDENESDNKDEDEETSKDDKNDLGNFNLF